MPSNQIPTTPHLDLITLYTYLTDLELVEAFQTLKLPCTLITEEAGNYSYLYLEMAHNRMWTANYYPNRKGHSVYVYFLDLEAGWETQLEDPMWTKGFVDRKGIKTLRALQRAYNIHTLRSQL